MELTHTGFGITTEHEPKAVGLLESANDDVLATIVAEPHTGVDHETRGCDDDADVPGFQSGFNTDELYGDGSSSIPFCQRRARRQPVTGWAVARLTDDGGERQMMGVRYIDSCPGGLGLESTARVEPGSEIILHFQGQSDPSRFGVVRWCRPENGGNDDGTMWRIGVECVSPVAAA